ncbi:MAG TPA: DUF3280 domain-containing protein [Kiloniellaceae bacterium]|nr:DUF3280 domain-containing protein [Kiloniellaceae bacterium]
MIRRAVLAATLLLLSPPVFAAEKTAVAVFDLELYDTSLEGELRGVDPAETARLAALTALLREAVAARADMTPVDTAPLRERLAAMPALYTCGGCEAKLARELGADRAVSGFVYKVSTLIIYINVAVRDTANGRVLEKASVSIRGNTDESWRHGMDTLLRRYLFKADRRG